MTSSAENSGIVKNIFAGYFILLLHVLLLVLLGLFIVFFRGLVVYMPWILGGGLALLLLSALWFYRRYRQGKTSLQQTLSAVPKNRAVEISLLGGLASVRVGGVGANGAVGPAPLQLEDPETSRVRQLDRLMSMYDQGLIDKEEFMALKKEVMPARPAVSDRDDGPVIDVDFTRH
ncbi:MAG: SHOCT domain-containing protein [Desulfuromonadaceae bacterium]|nr:SHOCT domain-containing protein [Desulfuromonadaceae bacterium]